MEVDNVMISDKFIDQNINSLRFMKTLRHYVGIRYWIKLNFKLTYTGVYYVENSLRSICTERIFISTLLN